MNGPVSEPPQPTHAQRGRRRGEHVLLEDLDAPIVLGPLDILVASVGAGVLGLGLDGSLLGRLLQERARRGYPSRRVRCL